MIKTRLMGLVPESKKYIVQNIVWQWLALVMNIAAIAAAGIFLESILTGKISEERAAVTALIIVCSMAVRFVCDRQGAKASFMAGARVKTVLREKIYTKVLRFGAGYRSQIATSEIVQISTEGVEQLETYFGKYVPQLFYSLLAPVTLFIALSPVSMKASAVLLVCVPLIPVSIVAVQKFAKRLLNKYWGIYTELGDSFLENLQGLTTLKIYQADAKKAEDMDREAEHFRKITMKVLTMQLNSISVMDIVAYGGAAAGMAVTVSEYLSGHMGFAGAFTMILLASEFFIPLRLLGSFFHIAMNGMAASDKIFRLLDMETPADGTETAENIQSGIDLRDVSFSYDGQRRILDHVSMEIPAGKFICIAGESGCGKSTVAALLMGRIKANGGQITVGGQPIEKIQEASLMRTITLVTHESYLFKGTVKDNLMMADGLADDEKMADVLGQVNLWDFLQTQEGLMTKLEERGSNFSGGQRQRLAIARALLHDSPVYIFDEATSNIDAESEEIIMDVIKKLAKTKTVILISHRLANAVLADDIYVLEHGKIAGHGDHKALMEQNGLYASLFNTQQSLENYGKTRGAVLA
ncbi:MAG TPA: ABC transporter ATP-binding protein/permease [Candidatus Scybalocola faecipullorum]|nr:ABC transporter ATP-binding protein/permease [Candidatus Scybalocola faecipullorum]